jgi:nucleotide-binding universal stress UspA family protein
VFTKILLALDGSESSDHAIPVAREVARLSGGALDVVHVREVLLARGGPGPVHADEPEVEQKVRDQVEQLSASGVTATLHAPSSTHGGPAHAIAEIATQEGADLIVLGTRGHSAVSGLLLGSVTQRLLHLATCPVLAVPPAADVPEAAAASAAASSDGGR